MSTATSAPVLLAGATGSAKASVLWSRLPADTERQILVRVDHAVRIGESELRYQLEHKDNHPLARERRAAGRAHRPRSPGARGAELCFRLTPEGRTRLAQDGGDRR